MEGDSGKAANADPEQLPPELGDMTVREALDKFEKALNRRLERFERKVEEVRRVENSIFKSIQHLFFLQERFEAIRQLQDDIRKEKERLEKDQKSLMTLTEPKQSFDNRHQASRARVGNQREKLYWLADSLCEELRDMAAKAGGIATAVERPGAPAGQREQEDEGDPLSLWAAGAPADRAKAIANYHLEALRWIDREIRELDEKITRFGPTMEET
jgi:DNA repair exonuclease SbcCD ATPase subunit